MFTWLFVFQSKQMNAMRYHKANWNATLMLVIGRQPNVSSIFWRNAEEDRSLSSTRNDVNNTIANGAERNNCALTEQPSF